MAVRLRILLPFLLFFAPFFAHASVISVPSNNIGLVGYWKFDEGSGSTAKDSSGSGNTGALTGSPSWVAGHFGDALQFTSSGQYVTTGYTIPAQSSATSFTWVAWINQTSSGGTQVILGFRNGSTWMKLTPSSFEYSNGGLISNTIPTRQWVQVVIVKNGSNFTYYQNGAVIGTGSSSGTVGSHTFFIGSDPGFDDGTPHYSIDDVRVYTRALSATEVKALYSGSGILNASYSPGTLSQGLAGYWTFDGKDTIWSSGTAATEADESGSGDTLTLNNFSRATASVIGKIGQALTFNDSTQDLSHSNISAFNFGTGDFSVSFWMKPSAPWGTGTTLGVIGQKTDDTFDGWQVYQDSSHAGHLDMRLALQNNFLTSATIPTGQWTLATFVRKGGNTYWYINGVLDNSGTNSASISDTGSFYIGYAPTWSAYYPGALDDVRIYTRALSASEVTQLYNVGSGTHVNTSGATLTDGSSLGSGLVGYWTFDGKDMYTNVKDESGQGNNGYLSGFTSTTSSETIGKLGQALNFNGSTQHVDMSNSSSLNVTGNITVSAWIKMSSFSGNYEGVISRWISSHQYLMEVWTTQRIAFYLGYGSNSQIGVTGNTTLQVGRWYNVVGVYNGTDIRLYVNGVLDNTPSVFSSALQSTSQTTSLGLGGAASGQDFNGTLDDVRVYDRALSASEIAQLYNLGK